MSTCMFCRQLMIALLVMTVAARMADAVPCSQARRGCKADPACKSILTKGIPACARDKKPGCDTACGKLSKKLQANPKGKAFDGCKCSIVDGPYCKKIVKIFDQCK